MTYGQGDYPHHREVVRIVRKKFENSPVFQRKRQNLSIFDSRLIMFTSWNVNTDPFWQTIEPYWCLRYWKYHNFEPRTMTCRYMFYNVSIESVWTAHRFLSIRASEVRVSWLGIANSKPTVLQYNDCPLQKVIVCILTQYYLDKPCKGPV